LAATSQYLVWFDILDDSRWRFDLFLVVRRTITNLIMTRANPEGLKLFINIIITAKVLICTINNMSWVLWLTCWICVLPIAITSIYIPITHHLFSLLLLPQSVFTTWLHYTITFLKLNLPFLLNLFWWKFAYFGWGRLLLYWLKLNVELWFTIGICSDFIMIDALLVNRLYMVIGVGQLDAILLQ